MASEATSRPLLPHTTQGQGVNFIPSTTQKEPIQRNYVFVDEHNRHKRLKVMRACEGCRRRKIKCDSATTNTWPCAACVRLKLQCVPPSVSYEKEPTTPGTHMFELQKEQSYSQPSPLTIPDYRQHAVQQYDPIETTLQPTLQSHYTDVQVYHSTDYVESIPAPDMLKYGQPPSATVPQPLKSTMPYGQPPAVSPQSSVAERTWISETGMASLADVFGDLQIGTNGQSPYIADQSKLANTPVVQEYEADLPSIALSPDMRVRIPPEMMPTEPQALEYFEYFFTNIHPFIPVLCQAQFYRLWNTNREALSPLILEGIFACTTAMLQKPHESGKWMALARVHEESFRDSPRLSTVQAQILLLKARECHPNRGYFYRSWMSLVNIIAMAKDLGLHEHLQAHEGGNTCQSTPSDCVCKTRIWQALFILEIMVGGPQGRLDYSVGPDTVDKKEPELIAGIDAQERQVSHQYLYFLLLVHEIRHTLEVYRDLRKLGARYGMDPQYVALDSSYPKWFQSLPPDVQLTVPKDGFEPYVSSAFLGNLHSYYYLSIIMHHRPQVHFLMEDIGGDSYKRYMLICLNAAKKLCRIQECMFRTLGPAGFGCMLRGMSFTIYALLTCTMLHLAAMTAPDPEISDDCRDYFIRCMRLLEQCTPFWTMGNIRKQIDGLREAFSADITKPFELKAAFPFGSPLSQPSELPVGSTSPYRQSQMVQVPVDPSAQVSHNITYPLTPPISIVGEDFKTDSPVRQPIGLMMHQSPSAPAPLQTNNMQSQWNPTRIFDKWHSAFYTTARPITDECSPTLSHVTSPTDYDISGQDFSQASYSPQSYTSEHGQVPLTPQLNAPTSYPTYGMEFVSPSTWQDVVASSYGSRVKRKWTNQGSGVPANKHIG